MAANWSRRLAKLKVSLEISLLSTEVSSDQKHGSDAIENEKSTSESESKKLGNIQKEKVKIVLKKTYEQDDQTSDRFVLDLDVTRTKVGQLKAIIEERVASFPSEKQLLIINDCATASDNEFLSAYKIIGSKRKSGLDQLENGFASACCSSRDQEEFSYEVCVLDKDCANGWEVNEDDSRRKKIVSNILSKVSSI